MATHGQVEHRAQIQRASQEADPKHARRVLYALAAFWGAVGFLIYVWTS